MSDAVRFMTRALELGFSAMGITSPNPAVGALIVRGGEVIAEGRTGPCGSDHAEACALKNARAETAGAEMFISLEPCCHYGKTPPCTDAIIRAGIRRVYIPLLDPNPLVAGKGVLALKKAGVEVVIMNEMASFAADLIRPFRKFIMRKRPFVAQKLAVTLDGRIATRTGDSRWISSEASRCLAHRLRAVSDAVIVGKNTMERDDPSLTVRPGDFSDEARVKLSAASEMIGGYDNFFLKMLLREDFGSLRNEPERIVIGLPDRIDRQCRFLGDDNYLFFADARKREMIEKRDDSAFLHECVEREKLIFVSGENRTEQVEAVLAELYRRGRMVLLLEGGSALSGSFFDAGAIDQYLYFIAPKVIGHGTPAMEGRGVHSIGDAVYLRDVSTVRIAEDLLYSGYGEPYNFEMM